MNEEWNIAVTDENLQDDGVNEDIDSQDSQ